MTERGDGDAGLRRGGARFDAVSDGPPEPSEPFDPSTREFPTVEPGPERDPGRSFEPLGGEDGEDRREREAERIEQRHEAVSMDTSSFTAIPAPTPTTPFVPPEFDERQGRLG